MSKLDRQIRRNAEKNAVLQAKANDRKAKKEEDLKAKAKYEKANNPTRLKWQLGISTAAIILIFILFFTGGEAQAWYIKIIYLLAMSVSVSFAVKSFMTMKRQYDERQKQLQK